MIMKALERSWCVHNKTNVYVQSVYDMVHVYMDTADDKLENNVRN